MQSVEGQSPVPARRQATLGAKPRSQSSNVAPSADDSASRRVEESKKPAVCPERRKISAVWAYFKKVIQDGVRIGGM